MKHYQKPAMLALSLSANDMLCSGTCDIKTRDNPEYSDLDKLWGDGNGLFTEEEARSKGLFGLTEECDFGLDNYCKYTANDNMALFTS